MQLSQAKTLARAYVRSAKKNIINDAALELILYQGIKDVARKTYCLPTDEKFNVVANDRDYNLSDNLTRYLMPDEIQMRWLNRSKWQRVYLRTMQWMDKHQPNWRDASAGDPQHYSVDGEYLSVYPKPAASVSDGFWFYFFQAPQQPILGSHYLFGHDSEIERLMILDEAVLLYWKVRAYKILGKKEEVIIAALGEYDKEVNEKIDLLGDRPDISSSGKTKYQGRLIR